MSISQVWAEFNVCVGIWSRLFMIIILSSFNLFLVFQLVLDLSSEFAIVLEKPGDVHDISFEILRRVVHEWYWEKDRV